MAPGSHFLLRLWDPEASVDETVLLLPEEVSNALPARVPLYIRFSTFLLLPSLSFPLGYQIQALCLTVQTGVQKTSGRELSWVV